MGVTNIKLGGIYSALSRWENGAPIRPMNGLWVEYVHVAYLAIKEDVHLTCVNGAEQRLIYI
jgi:hypothetical protein